MSSVFLVFFWPGGGGGEENWIYQFTSYVVILQCQLSHFISVSKRKLLHEIQEKTALSKVSKVGKKKGR